MERERRNEISYLRRRLLAALVATVVVVATLLLWWRAAEWITAQVVGDGASVWIAFFGVPIFVSYVVHRVLEEVRGE